MAVLLHGWFLQIFSLVGYCSINSSLTVFKLKRNTTGAVYNVIENRGGAQLEPLK